jgi:hypothetical protein
MGGVWPTDRPPPTRAPPSSSTTTTTTVRARRLDALTCCFPPGRAHPPPSSSLAGSDLDHWARPTSPSTFAVHPPARHAISPNKQLLSLSRAVAEDLTGGTGLLPLMYASVGYDPAQRRFVVFGGESSDGSPYGTPTSSTWTPWRGRSPRRRPRSRRRRPRGAEPCTRWAFPSPNASSVSLCVRSVQATGVSRLVGRVSRARYPMSGFVVRSFVVACPACLGDAFRRAPLSIVSGSPTAQGPREPSSHFA